MPMTGNIVPKYQHQPNNKCGLFFRCKKNTNEIQNKNVIDKISSSIVNVVFLGYAKARSTGNNNFKIYFEYDIKDIGI